MRIEAVDEYNEGGHLIYAANAPGAYVRGRTREEALVKFPAEMYQYGAWCGQNFTCTQADVVIVQEHITPIQICDADSDVLFDAERPPLTEADYAALKALTLRSAEAFMAQYASVPNKTHTVLLPRRTFYGEVPITAQAMYEHTWRVNSYYFGEIGVTADNGPDMLTGRRAAFDALEVQPDFLQNAVFTGDFDELWTLRKVCRRFIWHDRLHAKAMFRMVEKLCGQGSVADPFCFGL